MPTMTNSSGSETVWKVKSQSISIDFGSMGTKPGVRLYLESNSGTIIRNTGGMIRDGDYERQFEYLGEWNGQPVHVSFNSTQHNPKEGSPKNFQEVFLGAALRESRLVDDWPHDEAVDCIRHLMKDIREALMRWPNSTGETRANVLPSQRIVFCMSAWGRIGDFKAVNFGEEVA